MQPLSACLEWWTNGLEQILDSLSDEKNGVCSKKSYNFEVQEFIVDFAERKTNFLDVVAKAVIVEEIPAELVLNWDQTGIKLVPSSVWTMERQGENEADRDGGRQ